MYLSKASWAQRLISHWGLARRVAFRFVAGESAESALGVVRELNSRGILATLDHLGENTANQKDAEQATEEIVNILDRIQHTGVRANVSIKLSQIGLAVDPDLCKNNLMRILDRARLYTNFIRIDMEDSPYTDKTLQLYWAMRKLGYQNVGIVIQAYLYRSEEDICHLMNDSGRVRLCKGAYQEPPEVAFPKKRDVDENFDHLANLLIEGACSSGAPNLSPDGRTPPIPAFATHDAKRIQHVRKMSQQLGLGKSAMEFQMLYGIRRDLQEELTGQGYPVRVYVPFGARWYPYFMRRLAERPANLWFFLSNLLRK